MDPNFILFISGVFTHDFIEQTILTKMRNCKYIYIEENKLFKSYKLVAYNESETSGYFSIKKGIYTRYILYAGVKDLEKLKIDISNVSCLEDLDISYKNSPITLIEYNDEGRQWNTLVRGHDDKSPSGYFIGKWSDKHSDEVNWLCFTTDIDVFPLKKENIYLINQTGPGGREMWRDNKWSSNDEWEL